MGATWGRAYDNNTYMRPGNRGGEKSTAIKGATIGIAQHSRRRPGGIMNKEQQQTTYDGETEILMQYEIQWGIMGLNEHMGGE